MSGKAVVSTAVLGGIAALAFLTLRADNPEPQLVKGSVMFRASDHWDYAASDIEVTGPDAARVPAGSACFTNGGYSDIRAGQEVRILDERGTVLATADLEAGRLDADAQVTKITNRSNPRFGQYTSPVGANCRFDFSTTVPSTSKFYRVEVGHRDGPTFSRGEMEESGWTANLSLG